MTAGRVACAALVVAAATVVHAAFPRPQGRVNDFAGVLDPATRAELARVIDEVEQKTSAEIAVVTLGSLDGMSIEEYAVKLFADWGIGKKGRNNGVLVLVAPSAHRMRIEVGYGLEPILPDALAGRIIRQECLPAFRQNQYSVGILRGVRRVAAVVIRRETVPASERRLPAADNRPPAYFVLPFVGLFITIGAFAAGVAVRNRSRAGLLFAALFLVVPSVLALLSYLMLSVIVLLPLAAAMAVLGYRMSGTAYWSQAMRGSTTPADDSSPWVSGPSGGGSNGGGSNDGGSSPSGGDFGGGSSGGGGASASW